MSKQKNSLEEVKTCFVMMPISDVDGYPVGHFGEVYNQMIYPAVVAAGYGCTLATSTSAAHMIQLEVVTKVATADLCICDLSTNNPNVLFEYGIRQAFDKPTVLIKDDRTRRIFDLSGFRDIEYDHTLRIANTLAAREQITKAIEDTVSGSVDSEQVFSLVKLMKLTKAAHLPEGEVSRDDARFELLERKLDRLLSLQDSPRISEDLHGTVSPTHAVIPVSDSGRYMFSVEGAVLRILNARTGQVQSFSNLARLKSSVVYNLLSSKQKAQVLALASEAFKGALDPDEHSN